MRTRPHSAICCMVLPLAICLPTLSADPPQPVEPAYPAPPALTISTEILMAQVPPPPLSGEEAVRRCGGKSDTVLAKVFMKQDIQDQISILDRYLSNEGLSSSVEESTETLDDLNRESLVTLMKGVNRAIYVGSQKIEPLRKQLSEAADELEATAQRLQMNRVAAEEKDGSKDHSCAKAIQMVWANGLKGAVSTYLTEAGRLWMLYNAALSEQLDATMAETQRALKESNNATIVQVSFTMQRDGYRALMLFANASKEICENAARFYNQLPPPLREEPPKKGS